MCSGGRTRSLRPPSADRPEGPWAVSFLPLSVTRPHGQRLIRRGGRLLSSSLDTRSPVSREPGCTLLAFHASLSSGPAARCVRRHRCVLGSISWDLLKSLISVAS